MAAEGATPPPAVGPVISSGAPATSFSAITAIPRSIAVVHTASHATKYGWFGRVCSAYAAALAQRAPGSHQTTSASSGS